MNLMIWTLTLFFVVVVVEKGLSEPYADEELVGSSKLDGGVYNQNNAEYYGDYGQQAGSYSPYYPPKNQVGPQGTGARGTPHKLKHRYTAHARGEIKLDFSNIVEGFHSKEIFEKITRLSDKMDRVVSKVEYDHKQRIQVMSSEIRRVESKVDYIAQTVQSMEKIMQQMIFRQDNGPKELQPNQNCETHSVEEKFTRVSNKLEQIMKNSDESVAIMGASLVELRNTIIETYRNLLTIQQSAEGSSFCSNVTTALINHHSEIFQAELREMSSMIQNTPQFIQQAVRSEIQTHTSTIVNSTELQINKVKTYFFELAKMMVEYRDEYLKQLFAQNRKMEVVRKTVVETTHMMHHTAAGASPGVVGVGSRSINLCPENKNRKKNKH